jgi:hypothetical protein
VSSISNFLNQQKPKLRAHLTNSKGKNIQGKYLIIESDDWGAIRTPSKNALQAFKNKGLDVANSVYKNDSLASNDDVDMLFNLLQSFKDSNGRSLVLTANVIMGNPNFEKIKASNYSHYYYQNFTDTFLQYPAHNQVFSKWQQAISNGLFMPQFHGREHLQFNRWLKVLQAGNQNALFCFDNGATYSGKADYSFMEALDWDNPTDVDLQKKIITEGLTMFKNTFGFPSTSFIAPCYNWDSALENHLQASGINIIQGTRFQFAPTGTFEKYNLIPHFFGQKNSNGIVYNVRNCFLEPSINNNKDWVDTCLAEISAAFLWNKPAVICSHRINYVGFINEQNRDRGLNDLAAVIKIVLKKWPDVQFISTNQLTELQLIN